MVWASASPDETQNEAEVLLRPYVDVYLYEWQHSHRLLGHQDLKRYGSRTQARAVACDQNVVSTEDSLTVSTGTAP